MDNCLARKVSVITDHKPLVANLKKDVLTLLQRLQCILLRIHQCRIKILCKPVPDLFIADWLVQYIQQATQSDDHMQQLEYITHGWSISRNVITQEMRPFWTIRDDLLVIDDIIMKGRCIIIPEEL